MKRILLILVVLLYVHQSALSGLPFKKYNSIKIYQNNDQIISNLLKQLLPTIHEGLIILPTSETRKRVSQQLLSIAHKSAKSREKVIRVLIETFQDESIFSDSRIYLSYILSKLKAVESLNVIVRNLDLKGAFSSLSLASMPMVNTVVNFGEPAIPYLEKALYDDRILIREQASIALGFIGGRKAKMVLEKALETEANEDVIRVIKGGLSEIIIKDRQKKRNWAANR